MRYVLACLVYLMVSTLCLGQVLINELDCDTPGIDNMEFIELLTETPNYPLDGYVVVLFNGSTNGNNSSYFTIDLDGYTSDVNGLLLIGSNTVSPTPQVLIPENTIQNGADAVAVYQADADDFPEGTVANIDDLVDVLIYGTADADDADMIAIFSAHPNFTSIQQFDEGSGNNTQSIQRNNDGSYTAKLPTPGGLNDGGGVQLNGIEISMVQDQYDEGESFDIVFTLEENVNENTSFEIDLAEGTFTSEDYNGNTSLSILAGENSVSTTINLIDDSLDEGDEAAIIRIIDLPADWLALNNNVAVRIIDNDFMVAPFGTPKNPSYGMVQSTQPSGYYSSLDGKSEAALEQAIQDIIADPLVVRAQTYQEVIEIISEADQNPSNSNQVWLVYSEEGRAKLDFQTTSDSNGKWNREHTFPRSRAGYQSIEGDEENNGIDIFWETSADSLRHGNSDAHAIRAADGSENSARGNQHYGEYIGPEGTEGSFRGDVARSVLYLAIRYKGLQIVDGFPDNDGELGDLETILSWHRNDPPDDFEMNRNNVVYTWQKNRNPFIDFPDLVEFIWGDKQGDTWSQPVSTEEKSKLDIQVYPNPSQGTIHLKGIKDGASIDIYSIHGEPIKSYTDMHKSKLDVQLETGVYVLHIRSRDDLHIKKIMVRYP